MSHQLMYNQMPHSHQMMQQPQQQLQLPQQIQQQIQQPQQIQQQIQQPQQIQQQIQQLPQVQQIPSMGMNSSLQNSCLLPPPISTPSFMQSGLLAFGSESGATSPNPTQPDNRNGETILDEILKSPKEIPPKKDILLSGAIMAEAPDEKMLEDIEVLCSSPKGFTKSIVFSTAFVGHILIKRENGEYSLLGNTGNEENDEKELHVMRTLILLCSGIFNSESTINSFVKGQWGCKNQSIGESKVALKINWKAISSKNLRKRKLEENTDVEDTTKKIRVENNALEQWHQLLKNYIDVPLVIFKKAFTLICKFAMPWEMRPTYILRSQRTIGENEKIPYITVDLDMPVLINVLTSTGGNSNKNQSFIFTNAFSNDLEEIKNSLAAFCEHIQIEFNMGVGVLKDRHSNYQISIDSQGFLTQNRPVGEGVVGATQFILSLKSETSKTVKLRVYPRGIVSLSSEAITSMEKIHEIIQGISEEEDKE